MKTKIISKVFLSLATVVFVLGSAITQVRGDEDKLPVVNIYSLGEVTQGKTGSFVLRMDPVMFGGLYVNFSVSGSAIPGVDYDPVVSPVHIGQTGYGVILVKTLPRSNVLPKPRSVVVTLEPGPGYQVGVPTSAEMLIKP